MKKGTKLGLFVCIPIFAIVSILFYVGLELYINNLEYNQKQIKLVEKDIKIVERFIVIIEKQQKVVSNLENYCEKYGTKKQKDFSVILGCFFQMKKADFEEKKKNLEKQKNFSTFSMGTHKYIRIPVYYTTDNLEIISFSSIGLLKMIEGIIFDLDIKIFEEKKNLRNKKFTGILQEISSAVVLLEEIKKDREKIEMIIGPAVKSGVFP